MNDIIQECITKRRIVGLLLKYPEREFTVNELSGLSGISYPTAWRFARKLDKSGVILTKTVGHSTVCRLNRGSPFLGEVRKALEIELSPHRLAAGGFAAKAKKIADVREIVLFGSVAKGTEKLTSDIDILLITDKKGEGIENKIMSLADKILTESRMRIVPIVLTEKEARESKQFAGELERGEVLYERAKRGRALA